MKSICIDIETFEGDTNGISGKERSGGDAQGGDGRCAGSIGTSTETCQDKCQEIHGDEGGHGCRSSCPRFVSILWSKSNREIRRAVHPTAKSAKEQYYVFDRGPHARERRFV